MVFKIGISFIIIVLLIGMLVSFHDGEKINNKTRVEEELKTNNNSFSPKMDCLMLIENFAKELELDTSVSLNQYFKTKQSNKLLMCKLKNYRRDYRYKKAMAVVMLKIQCFYKKNGRSDMDFVRIYRWTPVLDAILNEVIYMQTGKEFGDQEVQVFSAVETKRFIARDKVLSKDKDLKKLIKECF